MGREKVTLLPPIPEDVKNKPLKFKEIPVCKAFQIKTVRSKRQPEPPDRAVKKKERPFPVLPPIPEETPDRSPVLKQGVTVFSALRYTVSRFRYDTPDFRKRPESRLHVQEMLKSEGWINLRMTRRGGYSYLISDRFIWMDFSEHPRSPATTLENLMRPLLAFARALTLEFTSMDMEKLFTQEYAENSGLVKSAVFTLLDRGVLPADYPKGLAWAVVYQSLEHASRFFRERKMPDDQGRLKFRSRWTNFALDKNEETGCSLLTIGGCGTSNSKRRAVLATDFLSQSKLPSLEDLRLSTGLQMDWKERSPNQARITFRVAKTKPIVIA